MYGIKPKPGLYDNENKLMYTWDELKEKEFRIDEDKNKKLIFILSPQEIERLKTIVLENNTKIIKPQAFIGCKSLENIILNNELLEIGDHCFSKTKLKEIIIPNSVKSIGSYAFSRNEDLEYIKFPENLEIIPESCCEFCNNMWGVDLPKKLLTIEENAFQGCRLLKTAVFPSTLREIKNFAFNNCFSLYINLKNCTDLKNINRAVFAYNIKTTELELPPNLESIGYASFYSTNIKKVTLPKSLKEIGASVFANCDLKKIMYCGTKDQFFNISGHSQLIDIGNGVVPDIEFIKTLDELIENGYSFRDANKILREYETERQ